MTKHKDIHAAMVAAQSNMDKVHKNSKNPHFKSKYADFAEVMAVVVPACNAEGVHVWFDQDHQESASYEVAHLTHVESGTEVTYKARLIVDKNSMQGMKSATTYARRIGIEGLTGVAPEEDDGNAATAAAPKPAQQKAPQKTPEQQAKEWLDNFIKRVGSVGTVDNLNGMMQKDESALAKLDANHPELYQTALKAVNTRKGELDNA